MFIRRRLAIALLGVLLTFSLVFLVVQKARVRYVSESFWTQTDAVPEKRDAVGEALRRSIEQNNLRRDVGRLAAEEWEGRENGSVGGRLAGQWIVKQLESLGLEPVFGTSFEQPVGEGVGTNIAGLLRGTGPDQKTVVLVAHYDHLGVVNGAIYPGADDNASGVAMALETARSFQVLGKRPRHDVIFLFPDAEEPPDVRTDTMGSSWFVDHAPFDVGRIRLAIVLDVVGGSPIEADPGLFFVLGPETSPDLSRLIRELPPPNDDVRALALGTPMVEAEPWLIWRRRSKSDYHRFRERGRPILFITSGTTPRYHTSDDVASSLNYEKMAALNGYVADLVWRAASETTPIRFAADAVDPLQDARAALTITDLVLSRPGSIRASTLEEIREARPWLVGLVSRLEGGEEITGTEYRKLNLLGLRVMCGVTRPDGWFCSWI